MEFALTLKYSEANQINILKIFSKTQGQEPKAEVPHEWPLKAKISNVYFGKSHMDCYYFC